MTLFDRQEELERRDRMPLAARMRPESFEEFVGQEHIIGPGRVLRRAIEAGQVPSVILWGPPGSGKTTLAHIIANSTKSHFEAVSAVSAGVADLRRVIEEARKRLRDARQRTILFIDEIHRFNKAQQDAVLPYVEDGTITLIGATTENPSFEVISPLLSRAQVLVLKPLTEEQIRTIIERAIKDTERGLGKLNVSTEDDALAHLIRISNNDARVALNALETAALATPPDVPGARRISLPVVEDAVQQRALLYDRAGEQHYDLASALIKSTRGSDPDAALYWLGRMLEAGEDPMFIARRLVILASEDIGLADPRALLVAVAAQQAAHFVGMPECSLNLAEAVLYLATAPKSNSVYRSYAAVQEEVRRGLNPPVAVHLRNPVTPLMKKLGYGKGYKYAHSYPGSFVRQQFLPDAIQGKRYYSPGEEGYEKEVKKRLEGWWGDKPGGGADE